MYICTGNICRSAMAHIIMKEEIKNRGLENEIEVYSCGTFAEDGDHASFNAIETMEYYGLDLRLHRATNIRNSKIEEMDLILCATKEHKENYHVIFTLIHRLFLSSVSYICVKFGCPKTSGVWIVIIFRAICLHYICIASI